MEKLERIQKHLEQHPTDYQSVISFLKERSRTIEKARRMESIAEIRHIAEVRRKLNEKRTRNERSS